MKHLYLFAAVLVGSAPCCTMAQDVQEIPQDRHVASEHRVQFEFHNSFLMNLHGFLLKAARDEQLLARINWTQPPSDAERESLEKALSYYRHVFIKKNLLFNAEMLDIKSALRRAPDTQQHVGGLDLAVSHRSVLKDAAAMYARCLWPAHRAQNQDWIQTVKKIDHAYGAQITSGIEHWMGHRLPSAIRTDIVAYSGFWAGAYTTRRPAHSVMESSRADYGGWASLEMIYHEASHVDTTEPLSDAIAARLPADQRDNDLWHAVQLFTVGEVVRQVLSSAHVDDYVPYAFKGGLFEREPWARYAPLLRDDWHAHMRGEISRDEALTRMVRKLTQQN